MNTWNTDKIIGFGLIIALLVKIGGDISIFLITGSFPSSDLPMNIVTGLAGYMGRSLLEKKKDDSIKKDEGDNDENIH